MRERLKSRDFDRDVRAYYFNMLRYKHGVAKQRELAVKGPIKKFRDDILHDLREILDIPWYRIEQLQGRETPRDNEDVWDERDIHPTSVQHFFCKIPRPTLIQKTEEDPELSRRLVLLYNVATDKAVNPENAQSMIDVISPELLLAQSTTISKFRIILGEIFTAKDIGAIDPKALIAITCKRLRILNKVLSEADDGNGIEDDISAEALRMMTFAELVESEDEYLRMKFKAALLFQAR